MSFMDKAKDMANQAKEKAGPWAEKGRTAAGDLAEKAGPWAEKAGNAASRGVGAAGTRLDKATSGKYSEQIGNVTGKVGQALDRNPDTKTDRYGQN